MPEERKRLKRLYLHALDQTQKRYKDLVAAAASTDPGVRLAADASGVFAPVRLELGGQLNSGGNKQVFTALLQKPDADWRTAGQRVAVTVCCRPRAASKLVESCLAVRIACIETNPL